MPSVPRKGRRPFAFALLLVITPPFFFDRRGKLYLSSFQRFVVLPSPFVSIDHSTSKKEKKLPMQRPQIKRILDLEILIELIMVTPC